MTSHRVRLLSAVHLFLLRDDKVLLLRRLNTGYEDGNYSVVAGHLDGGEEVVTAAIREAREEAGIVLAPGDMQVVGVMHRNAEQERVDFFVVSRSWSGNIVNVEPDKCDDLAWFDLDHLPANTVTYVRRALELVKAGLSRPRGDGIWFDSFGWGNDS